MVSPSRVRLVAVTLTALAIPLLAGCDNTKTDEVRDSTTSLQAGSDTVDPARARGPLSDSTSGAQSNAAATAQAPVSGSFSDTALVELIATVDRSEIESGGAARTRAQHRDVKAYARTMVTVHTADLASLTRAASAAGLTLPDSSSPEGVGARRGSAAEPESGSKGTASGPPPISNGVVAQLQLTQRETMSQLRTLNGSRFDRAYIDAMVAGHQQVMLLLTQNTSAPKPPALQAHAAAMERAVTQHLSRAKEIQKRLAAAAAADPTP